VRSLEEPKSDAAVACVHPDETAVGTLAEDVGTGSIGGRPAGHGGAAFVLELP